MLFNQSFKVPHAGELLLRTMNNGVLWIIAHHVTFPAESFPLNFLLFYVEGSKHYDIQVQQEVDQKDGASAGEIRGSVKNILFDTRGIQSAFWFTVMHLYITSAACVDV